MDVHGDDVVGGHVPQVLVNHGGTYSDGPVVVARTSATVSETGTETGEAAGAGIGSSSRVVSM